MSNCIRPHADGQAPDEEFPDATKVPSRTIGGRVRHIRKQRGLTQERLARRADVSLNVIGRLELGAVNDPHYSTLSRIAKALLVPVSSLTENPDDGEELPDIVLPQDEREQLKRVVKRWEERLNPHQLMYLAGAFEDAAQRMREREKAHHG